MKFCPNCQQMVEPKKNINWLLLIVLTVITSGGWLLFYALYYFLFKSGKCPICGGENLEKIEAQ